MTSPEDVHGEIMLAWEFYDRPRYNRGRWWYIFMILVGAALLVYALFSANFLFALIIVMGALVIYVSTIYEPKPIRFAITELGFEVGNRFLSFRDVRSFWFFYDPPTAKILYLDLSGLTESRVRVDLADQNPNEVRAVLARYLREDVTQVEEPLSDSLSRLLKI